MKVREHSGRNIVRRTDKDNSSCLVSLAKFDIVDMCLCIKIFECFVNCLCFVLVSNVCKITMTMATLKLFKGKSKAALTLTYFFYTKNKKKLWIVYRLLEKPGNY